MKTTISSFNLFLLLVAVVYVVVGFSIVVDGWAYLGLLYCTIGLMIVIWVTVDETRRDVRELKRMLREWGRFKAP